MAYIVIGRVLIAPFWDAISMVWYIGQWVAKFYDRIGVTPKSVPREDQPNSDKPGFWWGLFMEIVALVKSKGAEQV